LKLLRYITDQIQIRFHQHQIVGLVMNQQHMHTIYRWMLVSSHKKFHLLKLIMQIRQLLYALLSGSLTTISKIATPCRVVVLTVSKPSVTDKSDAASGIKLGTPIAIPPANIIAIIVRLVNLRPISFFMLLEFL